MKDFTSGSSSNGSNPPNGGSGPSSNQNPFINLASVSDENTITELLTNYNKKFKNSEPTLFRDFEINQTLAVLISKNKPNPLLVGPAGTGKTKIVEEIAKRIETGHPSVPNILKGYTIWELPIANIAANTKYRGDLEKNVQQLIDFASDKSNKAIIFIDEFHTIMSDETYKQVAQMLKPALARGDFKMIATTTNQEMRILDKDPALKRRFNQVSISELSRDQTTEIINAIIPTYMKHYVGVSINQNDLTKIPEIADKYYTQNLHRPDNAITLLDKSMANAVIERQNLIYELTIQNNQPILDAIMANPGIVLTADKIKQFAKSFNNGKNSKNTFNKDTFNDLTDKIKGQDNILKEVEQIIKLRQIDFTTDTEDKKPLNIMFTGSSGVGKTEVANIIAKTLTGSKPITLNMTEYVDGATINKLIGSPAGFVGSDSNEELPFDILQTNPNQVILLDEFEKCHPIVQRLFMQVFDKGILTTNRGTTIDFSKAIMIVTTNAGKDETQKPTIGFNQTKEISKDENLNALADNFDQALLGRFDYILNFNTLDKDDYENILKDLYQRQRENIMENNPNLTLDKELNKETLEKLIQKYYVKEFGARTAKVAVERHIKEEILKQL